MTAVRTHYDAIIIGAGPAGSTAAIRLAEAGWSVALIEKREFPRRKVCGECLAASNLPLLDALGVGTEFDTLAGPELRRVGLFVGAHEIIAPLPPMPGSQHRWGRALGREHLDALLLRRAAAMGAQIWQPFAVKSLTREGNVHMAHVVDKSAGADWTLQLRAPILIHAHGSWEPDPDVETPMRRPHRNADLFAFKGTYRNARVAPGLLPVLAFTGGYGGMVLGDHGLTTLAFCVRRDALQEQRARNPGSKAALAALAHVEENCSGVRHALVGAELVGPWLSVGPIRPGIRKPIRPDGTFAVGNVAGEAHPILGEGISMAIQSAWLLGEQLIEHAVSSNEEKISAANIAAAGREYARLWHLNFAARIRFAAVCAHLAMRPQISSVLLPIIQRWPALMNYGARFAGKVRPLAINGKRRR